MWRLEFVNKKIVKIVKKKTKKIPAGRSWNPGFAHAPPVISEFADKKLIFDLNPKGP